MHQEAQPDSANQAISGCSSTVEHQLSKLTAYLASRKRTFEPIALSVAFGSFAEINDTPKAAVRAAPIEGEADLAIRQYGVLMSSDLANRKKVASPFARFATFDRYRRMESKNPSKSPVGKRAKNTFLGELRNDREFRRDSKRIGLIALVALLSDAALFWLAGSRLANDANTYEFILFASFAATLVIISAALAIVLRVVDEFLYFLISRIDERQG